LQYKNIKYDDLTIIDGMLTGQSVKV